MTETNRLPKLTPKQKIFCDQYILHRNATKAYMESYKNKSYAASRALASRLLTKDNIKRYLAIKLQEIENRFKLSVDDCLGQISRIAKANMLDYVSIDESGEATVNLTNLNYDQAAAIQEVITEEFEDEQGRTRRKTKIKLYSKDSAAINYGKHLGAFKQKIEHTGVVELAQQIKLARRRVSKDADNSK